MLAGEGTWQTAWGYYQALRGTGHAGMPPPLSYTCPADKSLRGLDIFLFHSFFLWISFSSTFLTFPVCAANVGEAFSGEREEGLAVIRALEMPVGLLSLPNS